MKRWLAAALVIGLSSLAFGDAMVMDNKKTMTIDCGKDKTASIMGNENNITLRGSCTQVSVMGNKNVVKSEIAATVNVAGNDNTVTVDASDTVSVTGNNNKIAWKKG